MEPDQAAEGCQGHPGDHVDASPGVGPGGHRVVRLPHGGGQPGPSQLSAFRKPTAGPSHAVGAGGSPRRKNSSLSRRKTGGLRPEIVAETQSHNSDLDLPSFDRLPIRPELQRPDSVITTSSLVSSSDGASQAGDSSTEVGLHSVYAFSGLYGNKLAQVCRVTSEMRETFLSFSYNKTIFFF